MFNKTIVGRRRTLLLNEKPADFQGLFRVKIRKMAQGSNDLSTLPLRCPETLFISHENPNFLFSAFSIAHAETKTPKIIGCCRANFAFLPALKIGTFVENEHLGDCSNLTFPPPGSSFFESMVK